ncbi:MAG TPA: hypothetical protein ENJ27_00600 [Candidatus Moranbacteria bacterium]|nr:hypothetical protein [Candidatus Moranbacteria bacterium]
MKKIKIKNILLSGIFGIFMLLSFIPIDITLAQCSSGAGGVGDICFDNPLDYDTVDTLLPAILNRLQGVIVVLALVFIVIGALLYITSAGNESRMTMAKGAIVASVIGLAVGIATPSFLKEIYGALGHNVPAEVAQSLTISQIALNVLNFLLGIVGTISIIMLVIAGMMYLTAAGSEGQIDTAKAMTKWSIVGIIVALSAIIIVKQIAGLLT